jgi:hypothetical protein
VNALAEMQRMQRFKLFACCGSRAIDVDAGRRLEHNDLEAFAPRILG